MRKPSRWLFLVLAGCLAGSSFFTALEQGYGAPSSEVSGSSAKVNINKATAAELENVRGIGPMLAERIVKYREAHGRFERLEDLIKVPGIGQAKLDKIRDQVSL